MKRSGIRRQSRKRAASTGARRRCIAFVKSRSSGFCEAHLIGCTRTGTEGHELLRRSQGGDATNPDNVLWCCHNCHMEIHRAPEASYAMGLLKRSWEAA